MPSKKRGSRIRITDLTEVAIGLSEHELRIVTGGLRAAPGCGGRMSARVVRKEPTQYITNGDWDSD